MLKNDWNTNPRWEGITRSYTAEDVVSIRNSVDIKYTLAENGSQKLFENLNKKDEWISALGALSGNQAVQMVKAGLKAIYLSGWQVAADSNLGETTYPDQSLYPSNSAPTLTKKINNALYDEFTALRAYKLGSIGYGLNGMGIFILFSIQDWSNWSFQMANSMIYQIAAFAWLIFGVLLVSFSIGDYQESKSG